MKLDARDCTEVAAIVAIGGGLWALYGWALTALVLGSMILSVSLWSRRGQHDAGTTSRTKEQ
jgi:hypothetical protein